jgi:hypothetical protein
MEAMASATRVIADDSRYWQQASADLAQADPFWPVSSSALPAALWFRAATPS